MLVDFLVMMGCYDFMLNDFWVGLLVDFLVMMGCYDFMLNDFWVGLDEMIVSSLGFRFGRLVFVRWASPILNIYMRIGCRLGLIPVSAHPGLYGSRPHHAPIKRKELPTLVHG